MAKDVRLPVAMVLGRRVVEDHVERLGRPVDGRQVRAKAETGEHAAVWGSH